MSLVKCRECGNEEHEVFDAETGLCGPCLVALCGSAASYPALLAGMVAEVCGTT